MRVFKWCGVAGVAAFLLIAAPAMAQNCTPFADVIDDGPPPGGQNCPAVQWLKNRNITGGTTPTTYNPGGLVNRQQMALFLYRMGKALTPVELGPAAFTSVGRQDISTSPILCQTADFQIPTTPPTTNENFRRRAIFNSKVNVWDPSSDVELVVDVMYSPNSGAPGSWTSVAGSQTYQTLRATGVGVVVDDVSMYPIGFTDALVVGSTYRFGIRIARVTGTGNPFVYCENRVSLANRNGDAVTGPPYDEPERTGRAAQLPGQ